MKFPKYVQSGCGTLHFHQLHVRDIPSLHPHWYLVLPEVLNFVFSFCFGCSDRYELLGCCGQFTF
jgi:hypothetical protein